MNTDQHFWSLNQCLMSNKLCELMMFLQHLFREASALCSLSIPDALRIISADRVFTE